MTISLCWRRKFLGVDEIVFASDSRLSAGYRWDCAQKIFPVEGPNFCISFAGAADFAFPCIMQFQVMVRNYRRFATGAAPIGDMVADFLAICNQMLRLVDDRKLAQFNQTQFMVAGYDFERGDSYEKIIRYDDRVSQYIRCDFGGLRSGDHGYMVGFIGDKRNEYLGILGRLIAEQGTELSFQPLEALKLMLAKQDRASPIGGMPQVVKVYKHRNYLPYAVKNALADENVYLFGRPLLDYERTFYPAISLDSFSTPEFIRYPQQATARVQMPPPALTQPMQGFKY